jgi:hypothetical protein
MSNDCSERICQFGLAHVDTPLGDLVASSGVLTSVTETVVVGDNMYPKGTQEQFPQTIDSGNTALTETAHYYQECSNKGLCDRKTGECDCFENYDGIACERTICPSNCNNRGICYTEKQLADEAGRTYSSPWDALKHVGCICDLGYRGPDCSLQECPSGSDDLLGEGNETGRDCSGRGVCDFDRGLCKCFTGYFGTRCQYQTILG